MLGIHVTVRKDGSILILKALEIAIAIDYDYISDVF